MESIPKANKVKIIITLIIVIATIVCLIIFKEKLFRLNDKIEDNQKFHIEYSKVEEDNLFQYVDAKQAINLFNSEEAVIFFGFKECKWCQSYAPVLNEIAKSSEANVIYYCNIRQDRANNTQEYQQLVKLIGSYLYDDDNNNKRLYVPDVYFIKDKKIVGHNNYTCTVAGKDVEEYYTGDNLEVLKQDLRELFNKVYNSCSDSSKGC